MSKDQKDKKISRPAKAKDKERDVLMFTDWYTGMRVQDIAEKYNMSIKRVELIRRDRNWKKLAAKVAEKSYTELGNRWKKLSGKLTQILEKDVGRMLKDVEETERQLTHEERQYIRQLLENLNKISRLQEGLPTENVGSTGVVEHRVLLPPGVERFGLIPPPNNVKFVESEVIDGKAESDEITLDDVEDVE